jgi:predicted  nucleic acid-binding Zn-ribbon protein
MEQEEAGAAKIAAAEAALEKGRAEGGEALTSLKAEWAAREAAHKACETTRAEILVHMSPAFRSKYDRLRGVKQGVAIAHVDRDACSSCGSHLTPQGLMELKRRDKIPMCEGCSRLLYWTGA